MFIFNGLKAAVTISGSVATGLPTPASNQEIKVLTTSLTGTNYNAYTVTAGKTFYLTDFIWQGANSNIALKDNNTTLANLYGGNTSPTPPIAFNTPIPFTTSVNVVFAVSQTNEPITLIGYEQ